MKTVVLLLIGILGPSPEAEISIYQRQFSTPDQCLAAVNEVFARLEGDSSVGALRWSCTIFEMEHDERKHS